jgi:CheY-like chemotaxis protein
MKKYGATILVVEDEPHDQEFIRMTFKALGLTDAVQVVDNGAEAIAYMMGEGKFGFSFELSSVAGTLTDLVLPKSTTGYTVLIRILGLNFSLRG